MVHARLAIRDGVDRVSLTELDLVHLAQLVDLPTDERVVVWIHVCREESAAPVDAHTEGMAVTLGDRWEVLEPVRRIRKLFDLVAWHTAVLHDLELVLEARALASELALRRLVDTLRASLLRLDGLFGLLALMLLEPAKVFAEHVDFADQLVCRSADRHTRAVECPWKESTLAAHALVSRRKLDLGQRERMAQVQAAIHVRIRNRRKELGVLGPDLLGRHITELRLIHWSVDVEHMLCGPLVLVPLLESTQRVTLRGVLQLNRPSSGRCSS